MAPIEGAFVLAIHYIISSLILHLFSNSIELWNQTKTTLSCRLSKKFLPVVACSTFFGRTGTHIELFGFLFRLGHQDTTIDRELLDWVYFGLGNFSLG